VVADVQGEPALLPYLYLVLNSRTTFLFSSQIKFPWIHLHVSVAPLLARVEGAHDTSVHLF
jgi:hypothetical protein